MKTSVFYLLVLAVFWAISVMGCVVHTHHPHSRPATLQGVDSHPECPPSHYWDGEKCRHKGKGKGARKHDY